MEKSEAIQLGLGEKVVGERKILRGVIVKNEFVIVPSTKGYCEARLSQSEAEIERVNGQKIRGLSGWKTLDIIHVEKNINGEWPRWPIATGSIIGVYSEKVKRKKKEAAIVIKKNPVFSQKRF